MLFSFSDYEIKALKRVNKVKVEASYVNYVLVEDLIIHKIIARRERDVEDLKSVLMKNKKIDKKYVLKWFGEFEKKVEGYFL